MWECLQFLGTLLQLWMHGRCFFGILGYSSRAAANCLFGDPPHGLRGTCNTSSKVLPACHHSIILSISCLYGRKVAGIFRHHFSCQWEGTPSYRSSYPSTRQRAQRKLLAPWISPALLASRWCDSLGKVTTSAVLGTKKQLFWSWVLSGRRHIAEGSKR